MSSKYACIDDLAIIQNVSRSWNVVSSTFLSLFLSNSSLTPTSPTHSNMATATTPSGSQADFPFKTPPPYFAEEKEGWRGYVEWEKYPNKKREASNALAQHKFPAAPEFQLQPIPQANPLLEGVRWKQYHYALGETLKDAPDISWRYVQSEKSEDMVHVLQFPYNGEPPRVCTRDRFVYFKSDLYRIRKEPTRRDSDH